MRRRRSSGWPDVPAAARDGLAHVRVPATSANLGPGFDAFGLALSLFDDVTARVTGPGLTIEVAGEAAGDVPRDESHLVLRAMRIGFERLGGQPAGLELRCTNRIPHGRGLGSSAAAIVAGLLLARELAAGGDEVLGDVELLAMASRIEGHPDNVAACLLGGLTIAWTPADGAARAVRLAPSGVVPVLVIPPGRSSTAETRLALPAEVPHADAAYNAARAGLLVAALTGAAAGCLLAATDDRLHQPYRAASMPASARLVQVLRDGGIAAVVSGAGPTVLALTKDQGEVEHALARTPPGWRGLRAEVDGTGAWAGTSEPASANLLDRG